MWGLYFLEHCLTVYISAGEGLRVVRVCVCVEAKMEPWHCNLSLMTRCYLTPTFKLMQKIYTNEQLAYFSMPACLLHSNSPKDAMWALHLLCPSLTAQFESRECMQAHYSTRKMYFLIDWVLGEWVRWLKKYFCRKQNSNLPFSVGFGAEIRG